MASPAVQQTQQTPLTPSPVLPPHARQREWAKRAQSAKRPPAPPAPRLSLRRVKDSTEELKKARRVQQHQHQPRKRRPNKTTASSRTRGESSATADTSTSVTTATTSTSATPSNGRSFTVANFNQGIIYLRYAWPQCCPPSPANTARPLPRPVVRAGNHRNYPPPPFVFSPVTPPDSATLDSKTLPSPSHDWRTSLDGSRTPTLLEPAPAALSRPAHDGGSSEQPAPSPTRHGGAQPRSPSFSAADEHASQSSDPGTFRRVVIERPTSRRPKTADSSSLPVLEVPIPNYRLGTPRFSARGTAILRSSVYTRASGTTEMPSSAFSPSRGPPSFVSRRHSDMYSLATPSHHHPPMDSFPFPPPLPPSSARVSTCPIGPQIYDALTANPDDPSVVRFSQNGAIRAATPSRLIAHITSPSFLDYELLSDFFLTFRSFLSSSDLVAYLVARLRWAVERQDDFGRIVRVRTFVALRHWILNYFVDDFVPYYRLRLRFCHLVNALSNDLRARADGGAGDLKIVGELKKCWRRTCATYWECPDVAARDDSDDDILPGGEAASQLSIDDFPPEPVTPPRVSAPRGAGPEPSVLNTTDRLRSKPGDWAQPIHDTPQQSFYSPHVSSQDYDGVHVPLSPASEQSMQVLSCSIPVRGLVKAEPNADIPLNPYPAPHPIPARVVPNPQRAMTRPGKAAHAHKRSGSFSDALRDHRAPLPLPKAPSPDEQLPAVSKIPGSLIRGVAVHPSSPYLDTKTVGGLRNMDSQMDMSVSDDLTGDGQARPGAVNPGVKKILGSVRRALSSKQTSLPSTTAAQLPYLTPSLRLSHPASAAPQPVVGMHQPRHRPRPQARMDVLASKVAESFAKAVREETNEAEQHGAADVQALNSQPEKHASTVAAREKFDEGDGHVHSNVTRGSRSIVIFDDTGLSNPPSVSGVLHDSAAEPVKAQQNASKSSQVMPADEDVQEDGSHQPPHADSELGNDEPRSRRSSYGSVRRSSNAPIARRSMSETQMRMRSQAAYLRRGSSKTGPRSLRKHASLNSGLARQPIAGSVATTSMSNAPSVSSNNDPFFLEQRSPARQLRRRPGGDLRAVHNVHDLEHVPRPVSTGSVSNRTHSIANSVVYVTERYALVGSSHADHVRASFASTRAEQAAAKRHVSLVDTHSSQPNLRPSFEAEVAKLAALPDDVDDDGGIESALMKLEGRYEKRSPDASPEMAAHPGSSNPSYMQSEPHSSRTELARTGDALHRPLAPPEAEGTGMYRLSGENFNHRVRNLTSAVHESGDSYSSIPLLDRNVSEVNSPSRSPVSVRQAAKAASSSTWSPNARGHAADGTSPGSSMEYVHETDSMRRVPEGCTLPRSPALRGSVAAGSGRHSDNVSDDDFAVVSHSEGSHEVRSFYGDESPSLEKGNETLPAHPMRHPPTPPLTANRLKEDNMSPADAEGFHRGLPTPALTPASRFNQPFGQQPSQAERAVEAQDAKKTSRRRQAPHLPFVLAYSSETVAQQLTIVEKDALDEIDWKELIELRWKQSSPQIRDWVEYLRTQEPKGVDVVIARFNLVVKWVVSECLLTHKMEERARCIVKYIHIACHARRLRNYATMYQITIALLSTDCARLKKTWALVPASELQAMKELETLVQPLRNFHSLRLEMETVTVEEGCIPFIGAFCLEAVADRLADGGTGIYTRDLIYNAQKPAFLDGSPVGGERLVNFERHHTASAIVKSLLRLLEASSKYAFKPEPSVISKCLWMAALSDEEISKLARERE